MGLIERRFETPEPRSAMGQVVRWIESQVTMLLFWSAILLPVLYLSLAVTQINSSEKLVLFLSLVGLQLIALIGGHPYRRPIDS